MSFLDIKDPAERATVVKEYVTGMKTVKQRNMVNREMRLAIGDKLQPLFHPIVNATKQAAEETRKELKPMKKKLTDIDGASAAQCVEARSPTPSKNVDTTIGIYRREDGQLVMGSKVVQLNGNKKSLTVDATELTPGLEVLIVQKHPRPPQYNSNDYTIIIEHINLFVHRQRLDHSRIQQVLLDHTLHGNISICLGKWLYLEKG